MNFDILLKSFRINNNENSNNNELYEKENKYKNIWVKLRKGEKVILSYDEICDLEDYVYNLSEFDNNIFNNKFKAIHDKRMSCGISNKDHICSLKNIDMKNNKATYIN